MTVSSVFELRIQLSEVSAEALLRAVEGKKDFPEVVKQSLAQRTASVDDLKVIHNYLKENGILRFHEVLSSSEIILPEPIVLPRNPELEARVQRLKAQFQEQEYRAMTKNITAPRHRPDDSIAHQMTYMNRQLVAVAQFVFSVAAGFAFGFLGVELMVGRLDFGFRLLLGVICALIIALAEIYFLAKIIAEMDESETPQRGSNSHEKQKPHQD